MITAEQLRAIAADLDREADQVAPPHPVPRIARNLTVGRLRRLARRVRDLAVDPTPVAPGPRFVITAEQLAAGWWAIECARHGFVSWSDVPPATQEGYVAAARDWLVAGAGPAVDVPAPRPDAGG